MDTIDNFWISILLTVLGVCVIIGIGWFGHLLIDKHIFRHPLWDELLHRTMEGSPDYWDDIPRYVHDSYTEYLQRRNEFWTSYGQVLLAVLIVIVLAILLITKAISAEAGLPILSGISGFAIAKGVSGAKSVSMPRDRRPQ